MFITESELSYQTKVLPALRVRVSYRSFFVPVPYYIEEYIIRTLLLCTLLRYMVG
jgi:hypothetical protein